MNPLATNSRRFFILYFSFSKERGLRNLILRHQYASKIPKELWYPSSIAWNYSSCDSYQKLKIRPEAGFDYKILKATSNMIYMTSFLVFTIVDI